MITPGMLLGSVLILSIKKRQGTGFQGGDEFNVTILRNGKIHKSWISEETVQTLSLQGIEFT